MRLDWNDGGLVSSRQAGTYVVLLRQFGADGAPVTFSHPPGIAPQQSGSVTAPGDSCMPRLASSSGPAIE